MIPIKEGPATRIETDGFCAACGAEKPLHIHHLSWYPEITMPVCVSCHMVIHRGKGLEHYKPTDSPPFNVRQYFYNRRINQEHPEKHNAMQNAYYYRNRSEIATYQRNYRATNRKKINAYKQEWRRKRRENGEKPT